MDETAARLSIEQLQKRLHHQTDLAELATILRLLAARLNIEHFRRRLQHEADPATRANMLRRLVEEEMKLHAPACHLDGLSPEAHGTLLALQDLKTIQVRDEAVASELAARGYAKIDGALLRATAAGLAVRPFEEAPLNS